MKEETSSTSLEVPHLRWILVIERLLKNKNVCCKLFSPISWSAWRLAVCGNLVKAQGDLELNWWRMTANFSPAHFLVCPSMGLIAFTQIISQWPAEETHNTNSSICKPHPMLHWQCLRFLAAVRQHIIIMTRDPTMAMQSHRQWCAVRAAGRQSSHCLLSLLLVSAGIWCCTCCRFALWLHGAGSSLLSSGF